MMVALLVRAYANRVMSSRRMERLCQSDAAFGVVCGGNRPDHVTIARFRAQAGDAMAELFAQVLGL
jgi:transposase